MLKEIELDREKIMLLDSNNVSKDNEETKKRFDNLWKSANNKTKNEAVDLGGYKDTRSFTNAKNHGAISVRMVVALAIVFDLDPYYITAQSSVKNILTDENMKEFLEENNFGGVLRGGIDLKKKALKMYIEEIIDGIDEGVLSSIEDLENDEVIKMIEVLLIKNRIKNFEKEKINLIKILLLS